MQTEEAEYLQSKIEHEGFDYTFKHYSNFSEIEDKKFHQLRLAFLEAYKNLEEYIDSCIIENEGL